MKIDIAIHYWPATPALREVKLKIDGDIMRSSFMNLDEIEDLEINLTDIIKQLQDYRMKKQDE